MRYVDFMIEKYGEEIAMELIEELWDWRDIEGYEGLYKVSECGDVISLQGGKKRILKQHKDAYGYLVVNLSKKQYKVHRLVAAAFCEDADYFECVNHIDEDKTNNHYSNLEWCTKAYNNKYGTRLKEVSEKMVGNKNKKTRVKCVELDMTFESLSKAAKYAGGVHSGLSACLHGKKKTFKGYHWEYVD